MAASPHTELRIGTSELRPAVVRVGTQSRLLQQQRRSAAPAVSPLSNPMLRLALLFFVVGVSLLGADRLLRSSGVDERRGSWGGIESGSLYSSREVGEGGTARWPAHEGSQQLHTRACDARERSCSRLLRFRPPSSRPRARA